MTQQAYCLLHDMTRFIHSRIQKSPIIYLVFTISVGLQKVLHHIVTKTLGMKMTIISGSRNALPPTKCKKAAWATVEVGIFRLMHIKDKQEKNTEWQFSILIFHSSVVTCWHHSWYSSAYLRGGLKRSSYIFHQLNRHTHRHAHMCVKHTHTDQDSNISMHE